jgi:ribonuclease VapC
MFVDASALVAIIGEESDGLELAGRVRLADHIHTSAIALYEAALGLSRAKRITVADAQAALDQFVAISGARIVPITAEIGRIAIDAFDRFGRGRHPARLNMGDCFAYACARGLHVPLLFKGDDFPQTDIAEA